MTISNSLNLRIIAFNSRKNKTEQPIDFSNIRNKIGVIISINLIPIPIKIKAHLQNSTDTMKHQILFKSHSTRWKNKLYQKMTFFTSKLKKKLKSVSADLNQK